MLKKIHKSLCAALLSAGVLSIAAVMIWWFKRGSGVSFQDILFWVGAVPIVVFTMGSMGRFAGRSDVTYQMGRSVSDATPDQKTGTLMDDMQTYGRSWLNWILAGLILWLGSYGLSYFSRPQL